MAQSHWLAQRAIRLQNGCFTADGVNEKQLALFLRYQTTHQRAFYKALNTLTRMKKDAVRVERGFVSQNARQPLQATRFVSQNTSKTPLPAEFVRQNEPAAQLQGALRTTRQAA